MRENFHRPLPLGLFPDPPDLDEQPLNLFTLPYIQLIDTLSDLLFPPRRVEVSGQMRTIQASSARVDRYILFRAAWQPEFGAQLQLALRDLAEFCSRRESNHFADLSAARQEAILEALEVGKLEGWTGTGKRDAKATFELLHEVISEGLLGEPGYGGNERGLGWEYANFMPVEGFA